VEAEPRIVEVLLSLLEDVSGKPRRRIADAHGPYAKAVLNARPLAYWRLNEMVTPTARDATGARRAAAYEEGIALYLPGVGSGTGRLPDPRLAPSNFSGTQINRAPHFAGGRLRAGLPLGKTYSVELWLWNGLPSNARPVTGYFYSRGTAGDQSARGEHLGIGGTHRTNQTGCLIVFNGNERAATLVGRTSLAERAWHHIVFVREQRKVTVYLNGQPDLSGELEHTVPADQTAVFIGGRCDNFANFEGKIDEVAFYRRALSAREVAAHFKISGLPAPNLKN
jgi:hypothetical protein